MKTKRSRRYLAFLLAVIVTFGMITGTPGTVRASEPDEPVEQTADAAGTGDFDETQSQDPVSDVSEPSQEPEQADLVINQPEDSDIMEPAADPDPAGSDDIQMDAMDATLDEPEQERIYFLPEGSVTLTGRNMDAGEFGAYIYDEDGNYVTSGFNDEDGTLVFGLLFFDADDVGVNTFKIVMADYEAPGIIYDPTEFMLQVEVTEADDGTLSMQGTYLNGSVVFENQYKATGSYTLFGEKYIDGDNHEIPDGVVFDFEILNDKGEVVATTSTAEHLVYDEFGYFTTRPNTYALRFTDIIFDEGDVGLNTFTAREVIPEGAVLNKDGTYSYNGFIYDNGVHEFSVLVRDTGLGELVISEPGALPNVYNPFIFFVSVVNTTHPSLIFTNTVQTTTSVYGSKTWEDDENREGKRPNSIVINLLADGEQIESKTVTPDENGDWTWSFDDLPIYKDDQKIEYSITEDPVDGYTTTVNGFDVTNTVEETKTKSGEGSITLQGTKILTGRDMTDGEFSFTVQENGQTVATGKNKADGSIVFDTIFYTSADAGTHTYTVTEDAGQLPGVTYSTESYTVTVKVSDNGDGTLTIEASMPGAGLVFHNTYDHDTNHSVKKTKTPTGTPTGAPKTGDDSHSGLWSGMLAVSVLGLAALLTASKRRRFMRK